MREKLKELRISKKPITTVPQEEDSEETGETGIGMTFVLNQRALTETFETFRDTNAPPVVSSLKTAEAPVDVARASFAECAKFFVEVMSKKSDASDRKHDEAKAEMQSTYMETIETTNTGACFRDLYNDEKHTMAPFQNEQTHILSAQAIFAPFNLVAPIESPEDVEKQRGREDFADRADAAIDQEKTRGRRAGQEKTTSVVEVTEKRKEVDSAADAKKNAEFDQNQTDLIAVEKKARAALKRQNMVDNMRAEDQKKNDELRIELEKRRAADLAQKKAHVKKEVRAFLAAACPPTPAFAWPRRVLLSAGPNLAHILCARAARISLLADAHPALALLRADIELPPARRALGLA